MILVACLRPGRAVTLFLQRDAVLAAHMYPRHVCPRHAQPCVSRTFTHEGHGPAEAPQPRPAHTHEDGVCLPLEHCVRGLHRPVDGECPALSAPESQADIVATEALRRRPAPVHPSSEDVALPLTSLGVSRSFAIPHSRVQSSQVQRHIAEIHSAHAGGWNLSVRVLPATPQSGTQLQLAFSCPCSTPCMPGRARLDSPRHERSSIRSRCLGAEVYR